MLLHVPPPRVPPCSLDAIKPTAYQDTDTHSSALYPSRATKTGKLLKPQTVHVLKLILPPPRQGLRVKASAPELFTSSAVAF